MDVAVFGLAPAIGLGGLWSMYVSAMGLPLSPHGSDFALQWHAEAVPKAVRVLLGAGSFGVHWYALLICLVVIGIKLRQPKELVPELLLLLFGLVTFVEAMVVFLATPNVAYLLNAQTFSRTMLIPLFLLILAVILLLKKRTTLLEHDITY